jgi:hypothetical protein
MSEFKVGDRVVCVDDKCATQHIQNGETYTVAAGGLHCGEYHIGLLELGETELEWRATRFVRALYQETDPNGIDQHAPGAKLDAGKLRPALVLDGFANALEAVIKVGTDGAAKYTDNGWKEVANGFARYSDAEGRHRLKRGKGETHDKDSGSLHLAHEAWNALAKLELYLKDNA